MLKCYLFFLPIIGFLFGWPGTTGNQSTTITLCKTVPSPLKPEWRNIYDSLSLSERGLSPDAFERAYAGFSKVNFHKPVLAIADFSQSSKSKRFYLIDLQEMKVKLQTYVAHGRNSGEEFARQFSNKDGSFQSSLGLYTTLNTYIGKHGLSLRLQGLEEGINNRAESRAIVIHGADYVSENFIRASGRLGRSQGCPAVPMEVRDKVIGFLKGGAGLFLYASDKVYQQKSRI